jgi:hypothetical protein
MPTGAHFRRCHADHRPDRALSTLLGLNGPQGDLSVSGAGAVVAGERDLGQVRAATLELGEDVLDRGQLAVGGVQARGVRTRGRAPAGGEAVLAGWGVAGGAAALSPARDVQAEGRLAGAGLPLTKLSRGAM